MGCSRLFSEFGGASATDLACRAAALSTSRRLLSAAFSAIYTDMLIGVETAHRTTPHRHQLLTIARWLLLRYKWTTWEERLPLLPAPSPYGLGAFGDRDLANPMWAFLLASAACAPGGRRALDARAEPRPRSRISHRRIVWSLIIYCKQTVIEIFGKRQKYRVFFRSGPFFVRRREGLHGFGDPLQGAPRRRPVFPVLQHIDDRLVG